MRVMKLETKAGEPSAYSLIAENLMELDFLGELDMNTSDLRRLGMVNVPVGGGAAGMLMGLQIQLGATKVAADEMHGRVQSAAEAMLREAALKLDGSLRPRG